MEPKLRGYTKNILAKQNILVASDDRKIAFVEPREGSGYNGVLKLGI